MIKAGSVVPHYPVMQYVGETNIESLSLHIYDVEGSETSFLYEDANDGFGYKKEAYNYKKFKVEGTDSMSKIMQSDKGNFDPEYNSYSIIFHSVGKVSNVKEDGHSVEFVKENGSCFFKVAKGFDVIEIEK